MDDSKIKDVIPVMSITVDDGAVRVPINNVHGDEIGVFYFRPTDVGIITRYNKMIDEFEQIAEPLMNVDIGPDGTTSDEKEAEALSEAEHRLYAAVDKLFGGNAAEAFFGKMSPFSPVGGAFYCERMLEAVGEFIGRQFDAETKRMQRIEKYTGKYTGKKK